MTRTQRLRHFVDVHGAYLAAVLAVTAVMLYLWGQVDWTVPPASLWDGLSYRNMAQAAPGMSPMVPAPFRYRLLGTYTVGLLPIDYITGFFVLNYASFVALVVLLYFFLVRVSIIPAIAAFTAILFTFNTHLFGITVWLVFHTNDVLSLVLLLTAFWAMLDLRWGLFGLALFLGALSRETWVLLPPTAFVFLWERGKLRDGLDKLVLATLPAVAVTVVLRIVLKADVPGGLEPLDAILRFWPKILEPEFWVRQWGNSLIPLTFIPLVFLGTTVAFFRANKYLVVLIGLVFLSSLLGSANERLMAPAFVGFYWLLAEIVQRDIYPHKVMLFILAAGALISSLFHYRMARFPLLSREATIVKSLAMVVVVTGAAIVFRLRTSRGPSAERLETTTENP
jgi:hypothetical protein